jgi:tetratricopeptide (TPR) repeat protein
VSAGAGRLGLVAVAAALLGGVVGLQVARERIAPRADATSESRAGLYVRSPAVMVRAALSYRSILADAYWIRAIQHFGRTRLEGSGSYPLLYPLLDITTSLDPKFFIAYRFGAIFLAEPPPGGPGRPEDAIALLQKGLEQNPDRWEMAQDIGFVHYRADDYAAAARWFERASAIPGAPNWLKPLVAVTLAEGGSRQTSRYLWGQIAASAGAEEDWLRRQAELRLTQLAALDQIDQLERIVREHHARTGDLPESWAELVKAGALRGQPLDPAGHPYRLTADRGLVGLDINSPLNPLPGRAPVTTP